MVKKIMKIIFTLPLIWNIPISSFALGATRYVNPEGSETSPYDTWEKGAAQISTAITGASPGDIIEVASGTYDRFSVSIDLTIQASMDKPYTGDIIITNSDSYHTISISGCSVVLSGTTINRIIVDNKGASTSRYALKVADGTIVCNNVEYYKGKSHTIYLNNATSISINSCRIVNTLPSSSSSAVVLVSGTSSGDINYSILSGGGSSSAALYSAASGTVNVNNSILTNAAARVVYATAGTTNINNSVIQGGRVSASYYLLDEAGGQITATNCLLGGLPDQLHNSNGYAYDSSEITPVNCLTFANPDFVAYQREGAVTFQVDDTGNYLNAVTVANILALYGKHMSFFVNTQDANITRWNTCRALLEAGHDIGCHQYSNTGLDQDVVMNLTQSGGSNCTVAFDGATITCDCDGTDYDQSVDTSNSNYDTVSEIITALNGINGWTVTKASSTAVDGAVLASVIEIKTATAVPTTLDFDDSDYDCSDGICSGLFELEVVEPKAEIEIQMRIIGGDYVGWECVSFQHAMSDFDEYSKAAVRTAGFLGNAGSTSRAKNYNLDDIDIFEAGNFPTLGEIGTNESEVRESARMIAFAVKEHGIVINVLMHNNSGWCIEGDTDLLQAFVDELIKQDVTILSRRELYEWIRESGLWTDDGDGTWSREFTDEPDYSLRPASPAINAGADIWTGEVNVTDILGNAITDDDGNLSAEDGIDIGAYECMDTDDDGLYDRWEVRYFGDLLRDGTGDYDNDDLSDLDEYDIGTDPTSTDTDEDGMPDGWEVVYGLNPLDDDSYIDTDMDGYTNLQEYEMGTDPEDPSSYPHAVPVTGLIGCAIVFILMMSLGLRKTRSN